MDLYEYQARELFAQHGVPVLPATVVSTAEEAYQAAADLLAAHPGIVVVKAQVKTGGRGKAGGVKIAKTAAEAQAHASQILGMDIKGHTVHKVLIASGADIAEEYYFSILLDRAQRQYLAMCSKEGGMEIEQLAVERPEALAKVAIDPLRGIDTEIATQILLAAGFNAQQQEKLLPVILRLWEVYTAQDATLVEVNPLVLTKQGEIIALDGKVSLDDNARFRHQEHNQLVDKRTENPLEAKAKALGLNYVKLTGGQVGIIGNGAGLVMSTLDVVAYAGAEYQVGPANFLDIGGGADASVMANGLEVILHDPEVRSVFVNVFGGITACDQVAAGIVQALEILGDKATKPIVVRLDGNNVEAGREILAKANHQLIIIEPTMDGAAAKAARLAAN